MKAQVIQRGGEPEYAVIPFDEYRKLLEKAEMLEDIQAYDAVKARTNENDFFPAAVVEKLLKGNPVRVLRDYRNITASKLAQMCSVTPGAISQIENGTKKPSVELLRKLSEALNCEMEIIA